MISDELRAKIRRLFFAEHWKVGTIAAELGVHRDAVHHAIGSRAFLVPVHRVRAEMLDPYRDFILATVERHPRLRATRLLEMLRSEATAAECFPCVAVSLASVPRDTRHSCASPFCPASKPRWTGPPSGPS